MYHSKFCSHMRTIWEDAHGPLLPELTKSSFFESLKKRHCKTCEHLLMLEVHNCYSLTYKRLEGE